MKTIFEGLCFACIMMLSGAALAQERIAYAKPGLRAVALYDAPAGKKVADIAPEKLVNIRLQAKSGEWREIDLDNGTFWISAADVATRMGPAAKSNIRPIDLTEGANSGLMRKR